MSDNPQTIILHSNIFANIKTTIYVLFGFIVSYLFFEIGGDGRQYGFILLCFTAYHAYFLAQKYWLLFRPAYINFDGKTLHVNHASIIGISKIFNLSDCAFVFVEYGPTEKETFNIKIIYKSKSSKNKIKYKTLTLPIDHISINNQIHKNNDDKFSLLTAFCQDINKQISYINKQRHLESFYREHKNMPEALVQELIENVGADDTHQVILNPKLTVENVANIPRKKIRSSHWTMPYRKTSILFFAIISIIFIPFLLMIPYIIYGSLTDNMKDIAPILTFSAIILLLFFIFLANTRSIWKNFLNKSTNIYQIITNNDGFYWTDYGMQKQFQGVTWGNVHSYYMASRSTKHHTYMYLLLRIYPYTDSDFVLELPFEITGEHLSDKKALTLQITEQVKHFCFADDGKSSCKQIISVRPIGQGEYHTLYSFLPVLDIDNI